MKIWMTANRKHGWAVGTALAGLVSGAALAAGTSATPAPETAAPGKPLSAADTEFFEKNVRPVLAEQCFACHSSAMPKPQGGLRLDTLEGLLKGGDRGPSVKPGDPEKSLLLEALHYRDTDLQMPPKGKLPEAQIQALEKWVRMGAPWPVSKVQGPGSKVQGPVAASWAETFKKRADHWSFKPLARVTPPAVRNKAWVKTPIDAFVLRKLEEKGLRPSPSADQRTLIRRATFDLTGLPPTPEEVDAFVRDQSPDAWEKVVDRLLASPRYGERWGRHWLDLTRYAETNGHEFDFDKVNPWQYRDYVIRAFNADVPYSQFVTEQIAGDLLPHPRRREATGENESLIGTGFWWLGEAKHSAVDLKDEEREHLDNQIDVFSKTFTAMTVACARCHDHKFDAISTKDYYALSGYLKSTHYTVADATDSARIAPVLAELRPLQDALHPLLKRQAARGASQAVAELAAGVRTAQGGGARTVAAGGETPGWQRLLKSARETPEHPLHALAELAAVPDERFAAEKARVARELRARADAARSADQGALFEDFSGKTWGDWRVEGPAFSRQDESLLLSTEGEPRVEGLLGHGVAASNGLSERLRGSIRSRSFTIEKSKILYHMAGVGGHVNLIVQNFHLIQDPLYGRLKISVGNPRMKWYEQDLSKFIGFRAYIEVVDPGPGWMAVDEIRFGDAAPAPEAPNPRVLALLEDPAVNSPAALADRMAVLLGDTLRDWSGGQMAGAADDRWSLLPWLVRLAPEGGVTPAAEMAGLGERLRQTEAKIPASTLVMSAEDGTAEDDHVCTRGSYKNQGPLAPRHLMEVLGGPDQKTFADRSGRLELAQRLLASPITPRVWVNRVWQHHFGEGLVRTVDDFGVRGDLPTHPELLDWLAANFVGGVGRSAFGVGGVVPNTQHPTPNAIPWSTKALHRLILLSNTYQQSSKMDARADAADPQNKLLHRMPVLRLEAEPIRDSLLAISGRLDEKLFGPSVMPYLTAFMEGRGRPQSGPLDGDGRRSIYVGVRRNFLTPMFLSFDYPIPFTTIGRRSVSTVPAQALTLMNNPFVLQQAERWAKTELARPSPGMGERIGHLYETAFGRPPTPGEQAAALKFLGDARAAGGKDAAEAWTDLCHVLINTKEFIFLN